MTSTEDGFKSTTNTLPAASQIEAPSSNTDGREEWMLSFKMLDLRTDMRVEVLAVNAVNSRECLALAIRPVVNAIVAISLLFMLFRDRGRPASIVLRESIPPVLAQDLRSSADRLSTSFSGTNIAFQDREFFESLLAHLARACAKLPRHLALLSVRRAAERWRYKRNAQLRTRPRRITTNRGSALPSGSSPSGYAEHLTDNTSDCIIRIEFPPLGQLRMRKVVTRSGCSVRRVIWCVKAEGGFVQAEGSEPDIYMDLECDPSIKAFRDQPCRIIFRLNGVEQSHIPDCLATPVEGIPELDEFKPKAEADRQDVLERTNFLSLRLPEFGYVYRVRIAEASAIEPNRSNRRVIISFCNRPVTLCERELITRECQNAGSLSWGDAASGEYGIFGREILCRLFVERVLTFNIAEPLVPCTRFYLFNGAR